MPLGLYISVPFCRTKCSYCNFASGVFSGGLLQRYVDRVCADLEQATQVASKMGCSLERQVNSVYLGGGTPSLLPPQQLEGIFAVIRRNFDVQPGCEITVECAPGTLAPATVESLRSCGVNRVSLGVQSFVDKEAAAVGRLHTRAAVLDDIARLRTAGIENLNVDLIAGLPHQTDQSWGLSLSEAIRSGAPHISVYMLEVDEDSRLGRELIAGGSRYHAHFVPDEDAAANLYLQACERLEQAGIRQYEISNFARAGLQSRHNLKYWTRQPYLGVGVDAHSMLPASDHAWEMLRAAEEQRAGGSGGDGSPGAVARAELESVRFSTPGSLEEYFAGAPAQPIPVSRQAGREEAFFLGLRLNRGVNLEQLALQFGMPPILQDIISELRQAGLVEREGDWLRLTSRGRLLSNEVFERFIAVPGESLSPPYPH